MTDRPGEGGPSPERSTPSPLPWDDFGVPHGGHPDPSPTPCRSALDESAELYDAIYVSGGRRGLDVQIAPADLVEVTGAIVADISRSSAS